MILRYKILLFFILLCAAGPVLLVFLYICAPALVEKPPWGALPYIVILISAFSLFAILFLISDQAPEIFGET